MKKSEILKRYTVNKLDDKTVFINSKEFEFAFTKVSSILKEEFREKYRYIGGLQCEFLEGSPDYNLLENWLCEIAEMILGKKD